MKKIFTIIILIICATYKIFAGDIIMSSSGNYTQCSGNFIDGGGVSGDYLSNQNITITINPVMPGSKISITFLAFNTADNYYDGNLNQNVDDILYVYNGINALGSPIGQLHGQNLAGTITSTDLSGSLTFKFVSHTPFYTITPGFKAGWNATISCNTGTAPADITMIAGGSFTTCGGNFYDAGGLNADYMTNQNTILTLNPGTPGAKISVNFLSFNTASQYYDGILNQNVDDILYVYNGTSANGIPIATILGQTSIGTITSTDLTGSLTFKFVSHNPYYSITPGFKKGWKATISCNTGTSPNDITMIGGGSYTTCGGNFYDSGGQSGDYMINQNTTLTLNPGTPGSKISVNFLSFNTAINYYDGILNLNVNDILYVYNGTSATGSPIATLQGQTGIGTITSTDLTGSLTFKFVSHNPYYTMTPGFKAGWNATISCNSGLAPTDITMIGGGNYTTCGGNFYDGGGLLGDYMINQTTTLTLNPGTPGSKISVNFLSFNTAVQYYDGILNQNVDDVLYVYNGLYTTGTPIAILEGQTGIGTITSTDQSGSLTFKFVSHNPYYTIAAGYKAGWNATISCNTGTPPLDITMIGSGNFSSCGGNFYDGGGLQGDYMNNQNTTLTLKPATPGAKISVNFLSFNTQKQYYDGTINQNVDDILYAYDGSLATGTPKAQWTGNVYPGIVTSTATDGSLTFKFVSHTPYYPPSINGVRAGWSGNISCNNSCIPVSLISQPYPQFITIPNPANFNVTVTGTTPLYQWQYNPNGGVSWFDLMNSGNTTWTTGSNSSTLTIANTNGLKDYSYHCIISNSCTSPIISGPGELYANTGNYTVSTQLPYNISKFPNPYTLASGNTLSPAPPTIKICADGSNATILSYTNFDSSVDSKNIKFWIASDPNGTNTDVSGYFITTNYQYNGNTITAKFTHPKYLPSSYLPFRPDNIRVVDITKPGSTLFTIPIAIYRAPVLFVHGYGGDVNTFDKMSKDFISNGLYPQALNTIAFYPNSLKSFAVNAFVIRDWIYKAFNKSISGKFSSGKIDIISHSMGGILSRLYLQNNYGNIYKADINKLITLNTPHSGSYLADVVTILSATLGYLYCGTSYLFGLNAFGCTDASIDMQTYSYATDKVLNGPKSLGSGHVPSHTITTTIPSNPLSLYSKSPIAIYNPIVLSIFDVLSGTQTTDGVVTLNSQDGGLIGAFTSKPATHFHVGSSDDPNVISDVKQLLCANPNGGQFSLNGFNPPNLEKYPNIKHFTNNQSGLKISNISPFVNIISPTNINTFIPNQTITITINSDASVKRLLILEGNATIGVTYTDTIISSTTTSLNYTIPSNAIGKLEVDVIGFDSSNNAVASDSVTFNVNGTATLDSIEIMPNVILVPTNLQSNFQVIGHYSDKIDRDITLISGVQYNITNSGVAKIISPGVIEGIMIDSTQLIVSFQGVGQSIPVYVYSGDSLTHALFNSNTNTLCESGYVLFSNLSTGHPQSIHWSFPGGSPSTSTDSLPTVFYNSPGTFNVSLIAIYTNKIDTFTLPGFITVGSKPIAKIIFFNDSLYCSYNTGIAYQWYYNNIPIDSSNQKVIYPKLTGKYYVVVMNLAGCVASSDTFNFIINTANNLSNNTNINFYPNPNTGQFTLSIENPITNDLEIKIFNIVGQIVYSNRIDKINNHFSKTINLDNVDSGIYYLQLKLGDEIINRKVVLLK